MFPYSADDHPPAAPRQWRNMSGNLEQLVLLAILRLGADAYGARICEELAVRTSIWVSPPAIYTTLNRLERKGNLTSSWVRPTQRHPGGRSRRCYSLSRETLRLLAVELRDIQRMSEGVEFPQDLSYRSTLRSL